MPVVSSLLISMSNHEFREDHSLELEWLIEGKAMDEWIISWEVKGW